MPPIREVEADIVSLASDHLLVHQCNCMTCFQPAGLARVLFEAFPDTDVYRAGTQVQRRSRTTTWMQHYQPGAIVIIPPVVSIFGQIMPGGAGVPRSRDSADARLRFFEQCLQRLGKAKLAAGTKLAFPHGIGCGLAGGKWALYQERLQAFADAHPHLDVVLAKLPAAPAAGGPAPAAGGLALPAAPAAGGPALPAAAQGLAEKLGEKEGAVEGERVVDAP